MQSALELIAERGFHDAPIAKIIERAGVSPGTIYHYFAHKDILITELYRELEEKINATLRKGYSVKESLRERFLSLTRELLLYFIWNPLHFRYMAQFFYSPYGFAPHGDRHWDKSGNHGILMAIFEQGIEQQIFKEFPKYLFRSNYRRV